jgi:hypothetical protein
MPTNRLLVEMFWSNHADGIQTSKLSAAFTNVTARVKPAGEIRAIAGRNEVAASWSKPNAVVVSPAVGRGPGIEIIGHGFGRAGHGDYGAGV